MPKELSQPPSTCATWGYLMLLLPLYAPCYVRAPAGALARRGSHRWAPPGQELQENVLGALVPAISVALLKGCSCSCCGKDAVLAVVEGW